MNRAMGSSSILLIDTLASSGARSRGSPLNGADFPNRCTEVETRLVTRLRRSTVFGTPWREFAVVLRTLSDRVAALAANAAADYYAARTLLHRFRPSGREELR